MVPEDAGEISRSLIKLEGTKPAKLSQILMIMYLLSPCSASLLFAIARRRQFLSEIFSKYQDYSHT